MKPNFALNLTEDSIGLLHRTPQGWLELGKAVFGADDMDDQLAILRGTATEMSPRGIATKIVIPNSQIMYTSISVTGETDAEKRAEIRAALVGRTPYPAEELHFDWSGDGPEVQVAVVAQETLDEAEAFAVQYKFRPLSFVAIPGPGDFAGEPMFGQTKIATSILGKGRKLETDAAAIVMVGQAAPAAIPDEPVANDIAGDGEVSDDLAVTPEPVAEITATPEAVVAAAPAVAEPASPASVTLEDVVAAIGNGAPKVAAPDVQPDEADDPAPSPAAAPRFTIATAPSDPSAVAAPQVPAFPEAETEAPYAEVSDPDASAAASPVPDDVPPAPSSATMMAFASRRAAIEGSPPKPIGGAPPRAGGTVMPGLLADRITPRPQTDAPRPADALVQGAGAQGAGISVTAPFVAGSKKRKAGPNGAAVPPSGAAQTSVAAPRKPLTKPGGTFASSSQARGKPRFLGLILTGILILFLALVAAWSSFFLASRGTQEDDVNVAAAALPAIEDEAPADSEAQIDGQAQAEGLAAETDAIPTAPDAATAGEVAVAEPAPPAPAVVTPEVLAPPEAAAPDPGSAQPAEVIAAAPEIAGPAPETGVDVNAPAPVVPNAATDEIFLSSADAPLPPPSVADLASPVATADSLPVAQMAPPPFGTVYEFNANGTIKPTAEGIMTPEGVLLRAGPPAQRPPARPATLAVTAAVAPQPAIAADQAAPTVIVSDPALANARPRSRPASLVPTAADDDAALARDQPVVTVSLRPLARPAAIAAAAAQTQAETDAVLAAASADAGQASLAAVLAVAQEAPVNAAAVSRLAVSVSRIPAPRPRDLDKAVAAALAAATRAPEPEPETQTASLAATPEAEPEPELEDASPPAPISRSVADQATFVNALNLSRINLIGVYGTQSNRYALIRQANGRYKKVSVGDRIDGGTIAAITSDEVRYQKGGRLIALQMPDT